MLLLCGIVAVCGMVVGGLLVVCDARAADIPKTNKLSASWHSLKPKDLRQTPSDVGISHKSN